MILLEVQLLEKKKKKLLSEVDRVNRLMFECKKEYGKAMRDTLLLHNKIKQEQENYRQLVKRRFDLLEAKNEYVVEEFKEVFIEKNIIDSKNKKQLEEYIEREKEIKKREQQCMDREERVERLQSELENRKRDIDERDRNMVLLEKKIEADFLYTKQKRDQITEKLTYIKEVEKQIEETKRKIDRDKERADNKIRDMSVSINRNIKKLAIKEAELEGIRNLLQEKEKLLQEKERGLVDKEGAIRRLVVEVKNKYGSYTT